MRKARSRRAKPETAARGEYTGPRFFKVLTLSQTAQRIIRDGIQHHWPAPRIRRAFKKRTGERIKLRALQNFCARFRSELKACEQAADQTRVITETALKMGHKLTAAVQAELLEVVLEAARKKQLIKMGPYAAGKLAVEFADSETKKGELKLRREIERRKVKVQEDLVKGKKGKRATSKKNGAGKNGNPNQGSPAQAIRDVFGISNEKEQK